MGVVRCFLCEFEVDKRCVVKNNTVQLNKRRHCKDFKKSEVKADVYSEKLNHTVPTLVRPDDIVDNKGETRIWDGKKYKKVASKPKNDEGVFSYTEYSNPHPLTGDLSRFRSTASK